MKKILLCLLVFLMLCGCQKKEDPVIDNGVIDTPETENNNTVVEDSTNLADKYSMLFKEVSTLEDETLSTEIIANKLVDEKLTEITLVVEAVEEGPLAGFTTDITGFDEGYRIAPMIGTIPFVGYVFKTSDTASLIHLLSDNYDLRWNICTEADNFSLSATDDYVFVIMCSDAQA